MQVKLGPLLASGSRHPAVSTGETAARAMSGALAAAVLVVGLAAAVLVVWRSRVQRVAAGAAASAGGWRDQLRRARLKQQLVRSNPLAACTLDACARVGFLHAGM